MQSKPKHAKLIEWVNSNRPAAFLLFLIIMVLQSLPAIRNIVKIPVDPKNVFLLGLTRGRLLLLGIISALDILAFILLFSKNLRKKAVNVITSIQIVRKITHSASFVLAVIFWIVIWLPKYRLGVYWEEYERLRPLLIWLGGVGGELFLLLRIFALEISGTSRGKNKPVSLKPLLISIFTTLLIAGLFLFLIKNVGFNSGIIEPAPAPITPLQLFLLWLLVTLLLGAGRKRALFSRPASTLITAALLYLASAILFLSSHLPCKGDMVGIYPPNYACYPDSYDAVYQVGSLYTYFGEGIYNQWFTDKPIYMLFLTVCQWIAGIKLEGFMTAQTLFLCLLPPAIFLLARRLSNYYAALLAAGITIITQYNAILLYSKLGGVNILIAATEIFTAFLLTCAATILFKWFGKPDHSLHLLAIGIILGLTTLSRFNAALIIPCIGISLLFHLRKNKRLIPRSLIFFALGLAIALTPWFLINPIVTPGWENPYFEKIQTIFIERSASPSIDENLGSIPVTASNNPILPDGINSDQYDMAQTLTNEQQNNTVIDQDHGFLAQVLLHNANNIASAFFALPINAAFDNSDVITNQPFWDRDFQAIWTKSITPTNFLLWCFSIFLFMWGIYQCWRHHSFASLSPLIIFAGYHLGNSLALTSGGRYLVPVTWVVFLYSAAGLTAITKRLLCKLGISCDRSGHQPDSESKPLKITAFLHRTGFQVTAIVLLTLPAIVLPFLSLLPDQLPQEHTLKTEQTLYASLEGKISKSVLDNFVKDNNSTIAEGILFYPQYYNESRYFLAGDKNVFEALVLGKDHVYISYIWHQKPEYFTNGSRVLIAGCNLLDEEIWNMDRKVIQSYAIIQLDNERSIYIDPEVSWTCQ